MTAQPLSRLLPLLLLLGAFSAGPATGQRVEPRGRESREPLVFAGGGTTAHGSWQADVALAQAAWRPGGAVDLRVALHFGEPHLASLSTAGIRADKLCLLVTAERTFDADGWLRLPSDERMSTLLTPAGLAIEGGVQGAATNRYGYPFKSPFDQLATVPVAQVTTDQGGRRTAVFNVSGPLPARLPPGLYRLRFDVGVMVGTRTYNFNGYNFAARPSSAEAGTNTYFYSPIIPASGAHVSGRLVNGGAIDARIPWLLLASYNSNGYRGVIADEDRHRFATSDRNLIPDEVILPMYDANGSRVAYSLEPQFPADTIDANQNLAWNWSSGELSVQVSGPDGSRVDLGRATFVAKSGNGPTTKNTAFTSWKPQAYGRYTVTATGWLADASGRRYSGGGTYRFWIAKRMTLATATFQGMPYPVGSSYGRDIQFNPAFPADVEVTARLFVGSDAQNVRSLSYAGRATTAGLFGAAQGMKPFPLDAPGEYFAQVLARYTDSEGHLWVSTMRHAGVVYPEPSPVVARGKKLLAGGQYVDRGERHFEGHVHEDGKQDLDHITFPYQPGDVLLIGSEGQGANKIEPVLIYEMAGTSPSWDTSLNGVGTSNLRIKTSNGYSPHLYPEYITDMEYYYGAAPRPGFMGRFLVGESTVRAPYWPVSPNSFGGQIGASPNGDAPGDIYRLLGGIVLRRVGQAAMYSGYIASAFLLPKGTNNNRVVAAGSEDLHGPLGRKARFFLVGLRPGTAFEVGSSFRPAVQIDPLVPASITYEVTYPDGRKQTAIGTGDRFGSFAGPASWPLDIPGIYRYQVRASWNGYEGRMPGLPDSGGVFYVYSKTRPAGAAGLRIDGATQRTVSASAPTTITGTTTARTVHYALLTPGAVIEQGELAVGANGKFQFQFDPKVINARVPLYDIVSITSGNPQIGRVIHLTFFAEERGAGGSFHDVARVILRGTTALTARAALPGPDMPATSSAATPSGSRSSGGRSRSRTGVSDEAAGAAAVGDIADRITTIAATTDEEIRHWDAVLEEMQSVGELTPGGRWDDPLVPGRSHERLQQLLDGVAVFGGDLTRQVERGRTISIFGRLHLGIPRDLPLTPGLPASEAAESIRKHTGGQSATPGQAPVLVVLPINGSYRLAWRGTTVTRGDRRDGFVDAQSGAWLGGHSSRTMHLAADLLPALRLIHREEAGALLEALTQWGRSFVSFRLPALAELARLVEGESNLAPAAARGERPVHYAERLSGLDEDGRLRANATIVREVLRLAVEGGTNRHSGTVVTGASPGDRESIEQAFYRALVFMLPSDATLSLARAATLQALDDLDGTGGRAHRTLAAAWDAVGVSEPR